MLWCVCMRVERAHEEEVGLAVRTLHDCGCERDVAGSRFVCAAAERLCFRKPKRSRNFSARRVTVTREAIAASHHHTCKPYAVRPRPPAGAPRWLGYPVRVTRSVYPIQKAKSKYLQRHTWLTDHRERVPSATPHGSSLPARSRGGRRGCLPCAS